MCEALMPAANVLRTNASGECSASFFKVRGGKIKMFQLEWLEEPLELIRLQLARNRNSWLNFHDRLSIY